MAVADEPGWLIDKSAYVRLGAGIGVQEQELWARRIERGLVRISSITLLEIGYSARTGQDLAEQLLLPPIASMPVEYLTPMAEVRALEVMQLLANQGKHRAPSIPDILIAAIAEKSRLVVLHLDKDFDLIAEFTGQRTETIRALTF